MGATCVPPGGSEYYQELLVDGWLQEDDERSERYVDVAEDRADGTLTEVPQMK